MNLIVALLLLQDLRAGAAVVDATPAAFPVLVNGMFTTRSAKKANDPIEVRALVLDDGKTRLALAVVDSCMVPRDLIDAAKHEASAKAGVPVARMMVSSTHTHSAPSAMGCLGTDPDPAYPAFLRGRIAEAIVNAAAALRPAKAGWASVQAPEHTYCRRWILRRDKIRSDPFGNPTVRANMHPGYQNADFVGPSGPVDAELSMLVVRTREGAPLAAWANYSMHYYDSPLLSADYAGEFRRELEKAVGVPGFVAMMSQGTSGDQMWMDYGSPARKRSLRDYTAGLVEKAAGVLRGAEGRADAVLDVRETTATFRRRVPDEARLAWARKVMEGVKDRPVRSQQEVYAREAIFLHETPEVELKLQAIRVGDGLMTAIPNEVFGITGLKLKAMSPLRTMNVSLANGAEGYIPPLEQHALGGYTTWPARTAALEEGAEARIVETLLELLEAAAGAPRRSGKEPESSYVEAVKASRPLRVYRLGDWSKEPAVSGVHALGLPGHVEGGRCVQLAGGQIAAGGVPGQAWTVEAWVWRAHGKGSLVGGLELDDAVPIKTWAHVAAVREGGKTVLWVEGRRVKDVEGPGPASLVLGEGFEGRLDEVAVYDRVLPESELLRHLGR